MLKARVLVALQFGLLGILFLKPAGALLVESKVLQSISIGFYFTALIIFYFAYKALKPSLRISPIPKPGADLIVTGIYKWIRHPMYLSVLLVGAGFVLNNFNLATLIVFFVLLVNMIVKGNYEDSLLRKRHEHAKNYQSKTIGLMGKKVKE